MAQDEQRHEHAKTAQMAEPQASDSAATVINLKYSEMKHTPIRNKKRIGIRSTNFYLFFAAFHWV